MKNDNSLKTIIDNSIKEISDSFDSVLDTFFLKKNSLNELIEKYSENTDKFILNAEKSNNITFVGGEFKIEHKEDDYYQASADLYFKNKDDEWEILNLNNKFDDRSLTNEAQLELKNKKEMKFKILHPNKQGS